MKHSKKEVILVGFGELLLRRTFDEISVKDIVNQCGANRQTFYYYFKNKFDCLAVFLESLPIEASLHEIQQTWQTAYKKIYRVAEQYVIQCRNILNSSAESIFKQFIYTYIKQIIELQNNYLTPDDTKAAEIPTIVLDFIAFGLGDVFFQWILGSQRKDVDGYLAPIIEFMDKVIGRTFESQTQ
ncbi:TetR family transcriptional regulator [Latilactobacillus curvatus]|uniref:TetR family transcriptional regulator n=1 Tax=Latilactobacillus curvatus TaxID=28038 RepID=UPI000B5FBEC6|nr:TetR family transcriptional regulator [Latilactobacillus curvatus]ASN62674.1 hypothetical protein CGZ47_09205 [Latilactobacillus curvatus]MCT2881081.1 TetR family transcriptional regulator [Latilactobacillus curvatus]WRS46388.1 TetR family transcriptional regulator [Latilactobacillus curvatus]